MDRIQRSGLTAGKLMAAYLGALLGIGTASAASPSKIKAPDAMGLPEFNSTAAGGWLSFSDPHGFISLSITEGIKYVGLLAVISLTIGGLMYVTSYGVESKTKKAKNVIMYSLIGVLVAVLAYSLVDIINSIQLG